MTLMSSLNPIGVGLKVNIGCFNPKYFLMKLKTPSHPQMLSFNETSKEMVFMLAQSRISTVQDLDLTPFIEFETDIPPCKAHKITSYEDSDFLKLTKPSRLSTLPVNPALVD